MLNIMNYGQRFLKEKESEDVYTHNCVQIESDGLIDPYLTDPGDLTGLGDGSSIFCGFQDP